MRPNQARQRVGLARSGVAPPVRSPRCFLPFSALLRCRRIAARSLSFRSSCADRLPVPVGGRRQHHRRRRRQDAAGPAPGHACALRLAAGIVSAAATVGRRWRAKVGRLRRASEVGDEPVLLTPGGCPVFVGADRARLPGGAGRPSRCNLILCRRRLAAATACGGTWDRRGGLGGGTRMAGRCPPVRCGNRFAPRSGGCSGRQWRRRRRRFRCRTSIA